MAAADTQLFLTSSLRTEHWLLSLWLPMETDSVVREDHGYHGRLAMLCETEGELTAYPYILPICATVVLYTQCKHSLSVSVHDP